MKTYLPQILLVSLAISTLAACGGSSSSDYPPKFVDHQDIPPLHVRKDSIYTDNNQVNFPKYYPNNPQEVETYNKDVFVFPEPAEHVRR